MRILAASDAGRMPSGAGAALRRLWEKCARDNISPAAAAIAFFSLLAAFPGLGVVISIYGLAVNPTTVERHLAVLTGLLPPSVIKLLSVELQNFTHFQRHHLGLSLLLSLALTLSSGRAAVAALMSVLNVIYRRTENRRLLRKHGTGLILTIAILAFVGVSLALVAVAPVLVHALPLEEGWRRVVDLARWPVLALMMVAAVARLYRHAPHREGPRGGWFNRGACVATALWLVFSLAYSSYVSLIGGYDFVYGTVSSAVALMIWLYLSSVAVLLGAEIDSLSEEDHGSVPR
jgi:membrane protein